MLGETSCLWATLDVAACRRGSATGSGSPSAETSGPRTTRASAYDTDLSKLLLGVCVRCPSQGSHVLCSTSVNGRKQRPDQYVAPVLARYPRAAWRGVALSTAAAGPRGSGLFLAGTPASGASCCFFRQATSSIFKTYSVRPPRDGRINSYQRRALRAGAFACRHQCTSGCAAKSVDWPPCLRVQHTRCLLVACCGPKGATNL